MSESMMESTTEVAQATFARRSQFEIRMDVLRMVGDGLRSPTRIMYRANISWGILQEHLDALIRRGLVSALESNGKRKYVLTAKGLDVVHQYNGLLTEAGRAVAAMEQ